MVRRSGTVFAGIWTCLMLSAGCGGGPAADMPDLAPVSGVVTQEGKPLTDALVVFEPEKGSASSGITDATGKYELRYNADHLGAVPGVHTVRISKMDGEAGNEQIPARYNVKSEMLKKVEAPGPNDIPIEL